ncbi:MULTISPECIES: hypothetical protein [Muribaculaceae]|uniref:hypothetical protein n=1 Tax=Muribaculaceae TaxID=2005473 RepID=UPI000EF5DB8C|nr:MULTISPECIES: hypothetical protein [Muribaculaceae]RLT76697.1 hypothetical protein D7V95_06915 [bacterium J10(2018)]ROT10810.1 hypothetical protein EEL49_01585 [Muribaculaceae bacterium Isolate-104 (HZI)]
MTLLSILCTMGLPSIDDSLDKLLVAMETFPNVAVLGDAVSLARIIGLLLALCVGSYECWMMMLGRRGMDVMKLLRIVGISICISCSSYICSALQTPGKGLEATTKAMAKSKNKEVAAFELKVAQKQGQYLERLRAVQDSIATAQQVAAIGEDANWWDKLIYNVENLGNTINNYAQRAAVAAETKVSEWINDVIRFVGELIFQMSYYGILVAQRIFLAIMAIFCPIMFAMSLAPPWNSAWSQWMSKYLSLTLWGFITYMCLYYIDFILLYNLQQDMIAYEHLLNGSVNSWSQIGALGLQGIGSNCMYAMGMLVGAYIIRYVPEVASWLIPGGVSSGVAGSSGAFAMGAAMTAGSAAVTATSMVAGGAGSVAGTLGAIGENNLKHKNFGNPEQ